MTNLTDFITIHTLNGNSKFIYNLDENIIEYFDSTLRVGEVYHRIKGYKRVTLTHKEIEYLFFTAIQQYFNAYILRRDRDFIMYYLTEYIYPKEVDEECFSIYYHIKPQPIRTEIFRPCNETKSFYPNHIFKITINRIDSHQFTVTHIDANTNEEHNAIFNIVYVTRHSRDTTWIVNNFDTHFTISKKK